MRYVLTCCTILPLKESAVYHECCELVVGVDPAGEAFEPDGDRSMVELGDDADIGRKLI